jgi:uncharacterized membrane protein YdbT with pleckstrin-like domain
MKACQFCAEQIQDAATLCRYCNREQPSADMVLWEGSPRWVAYSGAYIGGFLLLPLFGLGLLLLVWAAVTRKSTTWRVTSRSIERRSGVISKRIDSMPLWRARDIRYEQTLTQRMLGDARLQVLSTDSSDPQLEILGAPEPLKLYEALRKSIETARRDHRVLAVEG